MLTKKIIVLSHCILNQNSVVNNWERASGGFPIVQYILEKNIGIIQLPCPELIFKGINRPPMTYEEYNNTEGYRESCISLLSPVISQLKDYIHNKYEYIGVIGINESPNCSITSQQGVFMEEFFNLCQKENINSKYIEIPTWYSEENEGNYLGLLKKFIEGNDDYEK